MAYARSIGYIKSNGESALEQLGYEEFYSFDPKHRQDQPLKPEETTPTGAPPKDL